MGTWMRATVSAITLFCTASALVADIRTVPLVTADTDGIRIVALGVDSDTYRIDVVPSEAGTGSNKDDVRLGRLGIDSTGEIEIRRTGGNGRTVEPLWVGHIERLESYGAGGVPGLLVRWRAAEEESIYGLGERFTGLDQSGRRCAMWNMDSPGGQIDYGDSYFCTPVLYSSRGYAFFATDNPAGEFDFNSACDGWNTYRRAGTTLTFYIAIGEDLKDLLLRRNALQGPFRGIPDWAWGPWISRNSYETQADAAAAVEGMTQRGWPVAAIVQEAWKGRSDTGDFNNFSAERWPNVDGYFSLCRRHDIRTALWQVPVMHPEAPGYANAAARGELVRDPNGQPRLRANFMVGFANIDFTNPAATAAWKDALRDELRRGVAAIKADDGEDIHASDVFFDGRRGWQLHNEFARLYAEALTQLLDEEHVDGLLWARSGSLGIERTPALWAGDQVANWRQLRSLLPAGLSTGLSGMPFWGHDIGGYAGTPTPELYVRWLQFGAFSPLMQYHGITPREPWHFGPTAERAYAVLVNLRMALQPTLIALGREAAASGLPIMRPMVLEYPRDPRFTREETQYLLGPDLLVAPVLTEQATGRRVAFPPGRWQSLLEPIAYDGPCDVDVTVPLVGAPVFVREGATLPLATRQGALPPEWEPSAPTRNVTCAPERALLINPHVPIHANALTRVACVSFTPSPALADRLIAECTPAGTDGPWQPAVLRRDGDQMSFELRTETPEPAGREQSFVVRDREAEPNAAPIWQGSIRWVIPVDLTVDEVPALVTSPGPRSVLTRLTNRCDEPVTLEVRATADAPLSVKDPTRTVTLSPRGTQDEIWSLDLPAPTSATSLNVRFAAHTEDRLLAHATRWFAPPWRWIVTGPFPTRPRRAFSTPLCPEWNTAPDVAFTTDGGTVSWQQLAPQARFDAPCVDFGMAFGLSNYAAGYALTRLRSDREQDAALHCGSDDTLTVWLNDAQVFQHEIYRAARPDQERIPIHLVAGVNTLLFKVGQETGSWQFYARLSGTDDAPLVGVTDGFDDYAAYDAQRPLARVVLPPPTGLTWSLTDPLERDGNLDQQVTAAAGSTDWPPVVGDVTWRAAREPGAYGPIDLNAQLGDARDSVAFAAATLHIAEATQVEIVAGADDSITLWLNGVLLVDAPQRRRFTPDSNRVRATLKPGDNRILVRIAQHTGDWLFQVAVWDISQKPYRPLPTAALRAEDRPRAGAGME